MLRLPGHKNPELKRSLTTKTGSVVMGQSDIKIILLPFANLKQSVQAAAIPINKTPPSCDGYHRRGQPFPVGKSEKTFLSAGKNSTGNFPQWQRVAHTPSLHPHSCCHGKSRRRTVAIHQTIRFILLSGPIHAEQERGTRRNKQGALFIMGHPCLAWGCGQKTAPEKILRGCSVNVYELMNSAASYA